ncbi:MAG: hypothetical protein MR389_03895 [Clostridiales bacterium]|nr:hypothetical protein [Clostridiales bacterium]
MRRLSRITGIFLILIMLWISAAAIVNADVWEFGSDGPGKNPFTPRGYLVDTEKGQHWLSSTYDNSGFYVRYSGVRNGVDYLEAKKSDGSNYTFYAMTDRNPWPKDSSRVGYGQKFLFAYKNGRRISDFNDYVQTPATRGDKVDPSGQGTCYVFKIEGFELEPGCLYEFGFLRGMQANNGITLVLAEDKNGNPIGYIQETDEGLTSEERSKYMDERYDEYEFISSWYKNENGSGYTVNTVPMRFTLQTYADMTEWEKAADKAQAWLDSVTEKDFTSGKYKRSNVEQLRILLTSLNKKAKDEVRFKLQPAANASIKSMKNELNAMLQKAQSDKPEPADISSLEAKLKEAKALYAKTSVNVGIDIGQYGQIEVENLKEEIDKASKMDKYYPQNVLNEEVEALDYAMTEVLASKVMEEMLVFYDKVTGIYVVAPVDSLPEDAKLFVRVMGTETDDYKSMEDNLSEKETEAVYYRIQFYQGDRKIQPTKNVEVQMPVPDIISEKGSTVYSADAKGNLRKMNSAKANGMHFFRTEKLSAFVLAGSTASEEEKAEARGKRMRELMAQKKQEQAENKETRLEKDKKKKEEFKDPLNKLLKRNANTATFSNDVRKETDPVVLIFVAVLLAIAAIVLGTRGIMDIRRDRKR